MSSMVVLVGNMPCVASLVSFGSGSCTSSPSTSISLDIGSYSLARRVSVSRRVPRLVKRWNLMSCKYQLSTAGFVIDRGSPVSLDSDETKLIEGGNGTDDDGPVLKPSSIRWGTVRNTKKFVDEQDRTELMQSLDVVLEKAEKLEASKLGDLGGSISASSGKDNKVVDKSIPNTNCTSSTKQVNSSVVATRKIKTLKSVWRKGDSRASVQRSVQRVPKSSNKVVKEGALFGDGAECKPQTSVSMRPAPPYLRPDHKLQEKTFVASPPIKKPVILKDLRTGSNRPILDKDGFGAAKTKDRHPIFVDKFLRKKPVVDPVMAQVVLAPTKPERSSAPGKFKDHKKFVAPRGPRRQIHDDDVKISKEDTSELSLSTPAAARKGRKWSKASRKAARLQAAKNATPVKVEILEVGEKGMLIEELAYYLAVSEGEILGYLYSKGIKPDGVQTLDKDIVKMICKEQQVEVIDAVPALLQEMAKKKEILDEDDLNKLENRPPVITIMGHVDHGKTTLLDYIRKTKVAASEAGGITQAIGAYKVLVPLDGKMQPCVFLDTPGHEAFGAMRARGARVTDIAVIVVAADDGIRTQTNEAIAHAKAAGVPIIIAINKIDKDGANPESIMHELSSIGLLPEDWGGDIPMVQTSALRGENMDDLLETVMLVAELQELKANPHKNAKGTVIEAGLHKSRGPVATFIVQNGTLKRGDVVVCGDAFGKMRALFDDGGKQVDRAGPSMPVQVMGLSNVPSAGDEFEVVTSLDVAREMAEARAEALRNDRISAKAGDGKVTLSSLASAVSAGRLPGLDVHNLTIILKVDVQGSVEAVRQALQVLPQDNVTLKFLLQATGDVSSSDIDLAVASDAIILGFNVKASGSIKSYAENKGVEIRLYKVIYELIGDVRNAMEGLLEPVEDKEKIGLAEVRAVFSSGSSHVAGCMVLEGRIVKGCGIRVIRKRKELHVGVLDSLRRVKELVKEVDAGLECGIGVKDYSDWEEGDIVEAFNRVQKRRTLEEASASMAAALRGVGIEL